MIIRTVNDGRQVIVEGLVPSRCSLKPRHVILHLEGFKLVDSECECGDKLCRHARLLYLEYFKSRRREKVA